MRPYWGLALAGLVLAACASTPAPRPATATRAPAHPTPHGAPPEPTPSRAAAEPERASRPTSLTSLPGWAEEDHLAALAAFQAGCGAAKDAPMRGLCGYARSLRNPNEAQARTFFENNFRAEVVGGAPGMLTAYFAPEYEARDARDAEFSAPVRPRPSRPVEVGAPPPDPNDPIDVALAQAQPPAASRVDLAAADRATIDRAPADGALGWMRPEDLFFLQIQGSGVLTFPDGRRLKAAYAADNGKPFVAIARPMVAQGLLKASGASGEAIRGWLAAHHGPDAERVMWQNPRYVFFTLAADDGADPAGAAGVPLPPGRSLAIDPSRHAYGELYWIDAAAPVLTGANRTYRRLAMALDTGSAIKGEVRADLYIGRGAAAGAEAGRVRHTLTMIRLAPIDHEAERRETSTSAGGG